MRPPGESSTSEEPLEGDDPTDEELFSVMAGQWVEDEPPVGLLSMGPVRRPTDLLGLAWKAHPVRRHLKLRQPSSR